MDIRMSVMDGLAATRAIWKLNCPAAKMVPIIAISSNVFDKDRNIADQAGVSHYFVKPLNMKVLLRELKNIYEYFY